MGEGGSVRGEEGGMREEGVPRVSHRLLGVVGRGCNEEKGVPNGERGNKPKALVESLRYEEEGCEGIAEGNPSNMGINQVYPYTKFKKFSFFQKISRFGVQNFVGKGCQSLKSHQMNGNDDNFEDNLKSKGRVRRLGSAENRDKMPIFLFLKINWY